MYWSWTNTEIAKPIKNEAHTKIKYAVIDNSREPSPEIPKTGNSIERIPIAVIVCKIICGSDFPKIIAPNL